jgi:hypothetical protein
MEEQLNRILVKIDSIEAKLDRVIKALQDHDGLDEDFNEPEDEYAWKHINPVEVAEKFNSLLNEEEVNKRMDIIGQNGNEGLHYDREKVVKASKEFGNKKAKETKEYLKGATFSTIPDFQHTPPPPKPKKKPYYKNKTKKNGKS